MKMHRATAIVDSLVGNVQTDLISGNLMNLLQMGDKLTISPLCIFADEEKCMRFHSKNARNARYAGMQTHSRII